MKVELTRLIEKSVADVWQLAGPDYVRAGDWASSVYTSAPRPGTPKIADAPVAGRVCQTSLGPFTETIETYDPARHKISYSATGDKMPGFVRSLVNTWHLEPVSADKTRLTMELNADIAFPFNLLMGWMMKLQFRKVLRQSVEEFAHFAEEGVPHPRKTKIDRSKKALAARQATA